MNTALQEPLLEAINILSQNAMQQSDATIVIECEIVEIIDAGLGQYTVKYAGNQFDVYSYNNSAIYQKGDIVFVLVPNGNLENTKMILGAVTPNASAYILNEPTDNYVPVSDNLFINIDNIELCTYHSENKNVILDTSNFNMIFEDYLKTYKNFVLTAKVKTDMPIEQQQGGNYGIVLNLPFLEDAGDGTGPVQTYKSISIDVNTMQGNPYRFNEYALQNIYFNIAESAVYDTSREPFMTAFVQDFAQSESALPADIWIRDIELKVVDILSEEEQNGYSLTLVSNDGNYFLEGKYVSDKVLTPILKINGKNKKLNDYECYWFVEDSSIKTDSDNYFHLGGLGWKCLNKRTNVQYNEEGKMTYQYVTNIYNLTVKNTDVISSLKYKCVVTKDNIVVGGSVCLKNLNNKIEIELVSATGSSTFVKDTGYVNLIARIYYPGVSDNDHSSISINTAWQRFDKNNNYLDNNFYQYVRINDPVSIVDQSGETKIWLETEIKYPCSLVENLNLINCSFYSNTTKDGTVVRNNLGTASIIIKTSDELTYRLMIQNGDVLYKYDADGDSPMIADYDGPASSKVKEILPLSYRLFKEDGTELSETEYQYCTVQWKVPKNSMIKLKTTATHSDDNYDYIIGNGKVDVNYTIIDTYNVKKIDNSIILTVNFNNNIFTEVANIKFLKDGESGTNGSKYAAIITYEGYGYGEINSKGKPHKLQPVYVNGSWRLCDSTTGSISTTWTDSKLDVSVYCDGEIMNSGYTVEWSMFDSSTTNPLFSVNAGTLGNGKPWSDDTSNIVQVKVTIGERGASATNSQEVVYAYYPIEITNLPSSRYLMVPNLIGGFDKVLYAADGTNPKYDNTNPFMYATNLVSEDDYNSNYYNYVWTTYGNLQISKIDENNACTIKPLTKFDNGQSKNYINTTMTITASGRGQVDNLINESVALAEKLNNEISYNQGILNHLFDFSRKFSYNNYVELLDNSSDLLLYRGNLIYYIDQLVNILNNLRGYCQLKNIEISDFNYNNIYNSRLISLNEEKVKLYNLGKNNNLDDLIRLAIQINIDNIDSFKNKYGIVIYDILNSYINQFNDIIEKKYWVSYDSLCMKVNGNYILQNQFNKFKLLETNIINLSNDEDLNWLQIEQYGCGPEQEFINLKSQLVAVAGKFFDTLSYRYSYDAIKKEILNEYQRWIVKYQNSYYERTYNNKIAALQVELDEVNVALADFRKIITSETSGTIKHSKPIVMIMNRYELSNINGWDGNKLYIDNNNNEYLLAPQVGAGTKTNGLFTGVIMGIKQFNHNSNYDIGLFGYSSGIQSFFLNSKDGSATLGKAGGGQVIIQPGINSAIIKSGNYSTSAKTGMQIDLTMPEIRFGSGNFVVNPEGHITAKGGGSIAGWKINDTQIYSDVTVANGRLTLESSGYGKIYSHSHNTLDSTNAGFYLSKDGLSIGNTIKITSAEGGQVLVGRVTGSRVWKINGDSNNSYIGNNADSFSCSNLDNPSSYSIGGNASSIYLGTDGIRLGNKFAVDRSGNLVAKQLIAKNGGNIGGWTIESGRLYSSKIELVSNGSIRQTEGEWEIKQNGDAIFKKLYASVGGEIGGWKIERDRLSGGNMSMRSEGSLYGPNWHITSSGDAKFDHIQCTSVWEFGSGSATWSNGGFNFGMGGYGSIASGGFSLSGSGTSWGAASAFSGGGAASYGSSSSTPFKDGCITHIENLAVNKIDANYINTKLLDCANFTAVKAKIDKLDVFTIEGDTATINNMSVRTRLTAGTIIVGNYNVANQIDTLYDQINRKADKGSYSVSGSITAPKDGGSCSFSLSVSI